MLKTVWKKRRALPFSHYLDLKMADYVTRKSDRLPALRKNRQMAIFANSYIGILVNQFGYFEHEELENLFDYLSPLLAQFKSGVALDIGANVGNHTIWFSDYFRFVHAFEPNPRTYSLLEFNSAPLPNVITHPCGLGECQGGFALRADRLNPELSSIEFDSSNTANQVKVKVETLDELGFDRESGICFVKMDVEGFEERVIRGGAEMIAANQPLLVLEQHEAEFSDGPAPSVRLLSGLGYKFVWEHKKKPSAYWLGRRLAEAQEILFGKRCSYISATQVPSANYTMLVAVPPRFQDSLGV